MSDHNYPEPVVGIYIFSTEKKLFLIQSPKWKNLWVVPGGHIEMGETMEEAVKREAKEETGLSIYDISFINAMEMIYSPQFAKKKHFVGIQFTAKTNDTKVVLNEEATAYQWVSPENALKLSLNSWTRECLKKWTKR